MKNNIDLVLAKAEDGEILYKLQIEAFMPLYEKYRDDETSPVKETMEKLIRKIEEPDSDFYMIYYEGEIVGGIRIRHCQEKITLCKVKWISPIFVIPIFQNRGIAREVIQKVFKLYPETTTWRLTTIMEEKGNCHLYEKCGFIRIGEEHYVNEKMTLIDYEKQI